MPSKETSPAERMARDEYYMRLAMAVRERASCLGSRVGAVLVL
ncbi:MAG: CMP deaminase, partial [Micromonosporaceae bacterium]|nr:CMP deaminase [Micromonosporaceae bacterium]